MRNFNERLKQYLPIVLVVMSTKGCQQASGIKKSVHETGVLAGIFGIARTLRYNRLSIDPRCPFPTDTLGLVFEHRMSGDVVECKGWNWTTKFGC